jgi:cellulose synthase/poly-beta-1,6-N-acetylglucosamine synthase-like glycosyltransferase
MIVREFARSGVKLIELSERRGKMAAINAAMPLVDADIVVLSDANVVIAPSAVRNLVRNFADPNVGVVSGDVVLVGDRAALGTSEDIYYRYERWLQRSESEIGSMIGVDGGLYAVRRELFVRPPDDTILDDLAIPLAVVRSGRRVVLEGDAIAFEQGSCSAMEEFARKARIVAGAVQLSKYYSTLELPSGNPQLLFSFFSHKVLRWFSPGLGAIALLSSILLASTSSFYLSIVLMQLALLAAGLAGCAPRLRRFRFIGMAHYLCLVNAAAVVGLANGLTGRQAVTWRRFHRAPMQVNLR